MRMLVRLQRKSHRLEMRLSSLPLRVRTYARLRTLLPKFQSSSRSNLSLPNLSHSSGPLDYSATQAVAGPSEWVSHRLIGVDSRLRRH